MLPSLSKLSFDEDESTLAKRGRESESDDQDGERSRKLATRKKLIEEILIEFAKIGPYGDPCRPNPTMTRIKNCSLQRCDDSRATLNIIKDDGSMFVPQSTVSSGRTLETPVREATAKKVAALYLRTVDAMDGEASVFKSNDENYESRMEIMRRELQTDQADEVWRELANDAYRALVDSGTTVNPDQQVELELSVQRADEKSYVGRSSYVHMDGGTYFDDPDESFATSFCAKRFYPAKSRESFEVAILGCGTILYKNVPIITRDDIERVTQKLKEQKKFERCEKAEEIVGEIGETLNKATQAALKNYDDERLADMGIETQVVEPLRWVDAHSRTFHRSPNYSDIFWSDENTPSDPWARSVFEWAKSMLSFKPNETSQMRFFSRLSVGRKRAPSRKYVEGLFLDRQFDGIADGKASALVTIRIQEFRA